MEDELEKDKDEKIFLFFILYKYGHLSQCKEIGQDVVASQFSFQRILSRIE